MIAGYLNRAQKTIYQYGCRRMLWRLFHVARDWEFACDCVFFFLSSSLRPWFVCQTNPPRVWSLPGSSGREMWEHLWPRECVDGTSKIKKYIETLVCLQGNVIFFQGFFFIVQDLYVWWCPCKRNFILKWELQCFWEVPLVTFKACREQLKISGIHGWDVFQYDQEPPINGMIQLALILVNSLCI